MDILIAGFAALFAITLAGLVLAQDPSKRHVQLFAAMSVMTVGWVGANYVTNHSLDNLVLTNAANKLAFLFGGGSVIFGLLFTYYFPLRRKVSAFEKFSLISVSILLAVTSFSDIVVGTAINRYGQLDFISGEWIWCYVVGFAVVAFMIVHNLIRPQLVRTGLEILQSRLIAAAFILSSMVGLILNVIIPELVSNWESTRFGPFVVIVLVGVISYTIVRHKLFDIKLAAVRSIAYVMTLLTLSASYYGLALIVSAVISYVSHGDESGLINPLSIVLALVLAYVFQPIRSFFDRMTNRIFFRANYDPDAFTSKLGKILTSTVVLNKLLERAAMEIADTLKASHATFVVYDDKRLNTVKSHGTFRKLSSETYEKLQHYVYDSSEAAISVESMAQETYSHTDAGKLYRSLSRKNIALILPLHGGLGYLLLGEQKAGGYSQRDLRILDSLISELSIAIQNALSIEELRELNTTLQQRIDSATSELRRTNQKLRQLDATKDEFISMASHQLRTPLTSVKGYLSMVLDGDVGAVSEQQRSMLEEAFTSSERMVHLIGDFLNVSRLQTGKFMIDAKPSDLSMVVQEEVESMKRLAKSHGITLEYKKPSVVPILFVDVDKLRQVIMNFIDNAIYYSPENSTVKVKLSKSEGELLLEVRDEGMGVPEDVQNRLFTKFFRAENARKQRPDGTGIGLYLAKKVIAAHGGMIIFRTRSGKGSVFGFRLPIAKLSDKDKLIS